MEEQSDKLARQGEHGISLNSQWKNIEEFQMFLNNEPDKKDIKINKQVGKTPNDEPVRYLPIGVVERTLDQVFSGLYNITITDIRVVANEIGYAVLLEVFHPIAKVWIKRAGVGWAQIRMKADSQLTDYNMKYKVALTADGPHAYAEAIKNAAKKFGVRFGRNLNRDDNYLDYETLSEMTPEQETIDELKGMIDACKSEEELKAVKRAYKDQIKHLQVKQMLIKKYKELNINP